MRETLQLSVQEAMTTTPLVVRPTDKINDVANLFHENEISAAPVVDEAGRCIGIITSSDLVRFHCKADGVYARIDQGMTFGVSNDDEEGPLELIPHPFDEVQRQMTSAVQSIPGNQSLAEAAKMMKKMHVHHLVVLDEPGHVVGILSALDVLAKLIED